MGQNEPATVLYHGFLSARWSIISRAASTEGAVQTFSRNVGFSRRICAGNTLIDFDDESLAEIPPLNWDEDDLAFAIELIEETDTIMQDVTAGLEFLSSQPDLLEALQLNIRRIYTAIDRQIGKHDEVKVRLQWPLLSSAT